MSSKVFLLGAFCSLLGKVFSQTGLINDTFTASLNSPWSRVNTQIINNELVVIPNRSSATQWRGDLVRTGGVVFHAGNYPIVAIKMNKPPRSNMFFDTNLGSYNGTSNNQRVIVTNDGGHIFYWDLSKGKLGSTTLSLVSPTTLSLFQFKIAEIEFNAAQIAQKDTTYEVQWFKTFATEAEMRTYVGADPLITVNFSGTFKHPGLMHDTADFARMRKFIAHKTSRPYSSYLKLIADARSSKTWKLRGPFKVLTRESSWLENGITYTSTQNGVENDFNAAYYNAVMWNLTKDSAHAKKSIEILNAYADSTERIVGAAEELEGLYAFLYCNAAELMVHTYKSWPQDRIQKSKEMLMKVFLPWVQNFKPCSHGNWDIICMKAMMALAIYTDDLVMYNKVINYYYNGEGNGSIKNYIVSDAGQLQESNRDQGHSTLGIGCLAEICEMAYKQGTDLYLAKNNAVMRAYEYTAQYNNGFEVPFITWYDYCQRNLKDYTPDTISSKGRPSVRPIWEIAYNHYTYLKKHSMPQTLTMLQNIGSEGGSNADNTAFGSLLYFLGQNEDHDVLNSVETFASFDGYSYQVYQSGVFLYHLEENSDIKVYEISGKGVFHTTNTADQIDIKINNPGIYMVKVLGKTQSYTLKIGMRSE